MNNEGNNNKTLDDIVSEESSLLTQHEIDTIVSSFISENCSSSKSKPFIKELEFFESNDGDETNNVFTKINHTQTTIGKEMLKGLISNPISSNYKLNERKECLSYWINMDDSKLDDTINKIKQIGKDEGRILWFMKDKSDDMNKLQDSMLFFNSFWNNWINNKSILMNYYYYFTLMIYPLYGILAPVLGIIFPYLLMRFIFGLKIPLKIYWSLVWNSLFSSGVSLFGTMINMVTRRNPDSFISSAANFLVNSKIINLVYYVVIGGIYLYGIYNTLKIAYSQLNLINMIHKKINNLYNLFKTTRDLVSEHGHFSCSNIYCDKTIISQQVELFGEKFSGRSKGDCGSDRGSDCGSDCGVNWSGNNLKNNIIDVILNCGNFDHEPYLFSNKGITLSIYWYLKDIEFMKQILNPYINYIGNIDIWSSLGKLFKSSNQYYSLPKYIENVKPYVNLEEFHNIMVNKDKSISNNVLIGSGSSGKNMIITGANASGKSTFIKGITTCIILAQTICMVPCKTMDFTPFLRINTYLNIPDCQGKESLFQAEMNRCMKQINELKGLSENSFSFNIMDEIFVSTNYLEGVSGAYALAKKMASFHNSITVIATHFPELGKYCMEYDNYHFKGASNSDSLNNYKLLKGQSREHFALKLLEDKGFDKDIIKDANHMYKKMVKMSKASDELDKLKKRIKVKVNEEENIKVIEKVGKIEKKIKEKNKNKIKK